jgi:hypothetical protein
METQSVFSDAGTNISNNILINLKFQRINLLHINLYRHIYTFTQQNRNFHIYPPDKEIRFRDLIVRIFRLNGNKEQLRYFPMLKTEIFFSFSLNFMSMPAYCFLCYVVFNMLRLRLCYVVIFIPIVGE